MARKYAVSDGEMVLQLHEAEEGGYDVTSPLDPELITEAETVAEAFANARDALKAVTQSRAKLMKKAPRARVGLGGRPWTGRKLERHLRDYGCSCIIMAAGMISG